eukprot:NODE_1678_length_1086_cov_286.432590.p1 GENE.NODE_1678_length_1086_cov_286.432590~~NODE_1678_length_1086_cov_286.432590.p1  ORF type:complete len:331 (+),score=92.69 NODE_1678_length_1086_cov_286.432590:3-995(+)
MGNSKLCEQLISFASELSEAIRGLPASPDRLEKASPLIQGLTAMLDELERWIDDFPPIQQPMRFGNKAFRLWHARLVERAKDLMLTVLQKLPSPLPVDLEAFASELSCYLCGAFGDERRIDYGTGHEASFFAVLFALGLRNLLLRQDAPDAVLVVFAAYMRVMRRLQTVYVLEPAGSHGVWGLDDFHMLPFLFGSAQLIGLEEEVPPGTVYQERVVRDHRAAFLYVDAIYQILLVKKGAPFHETSPMLYDIGQIPEWQKIHNGLVKMYSGEVLGKFPVIQHFLFGQTLPWPGDASDQGAAVGRTPEQLAFARSAAAAMPPPPHLPASRRR